MLPRTAHQFRTRLVVLAVMSLPAAVLGCKPGVTDPAGTAAPVSASTPSPASHLGSTATSAPIPTATLTLGEWLKPYTLEGLREREYRREALAGREETARTDLFTRYAITYRSDDLLISGTMQIPAQGEGPFPVIVMNHGYFNRAEYNSGDGTDRAAEYLNRHGYLTLSSDYRSWGSSQTGPSLFYSGLVIDAANLVMAARSIPEADGDRIGMWGHSMGGGVTMKALTLDVPVRAAVLYSTVSADDSDILARWGLGCIGDIEAGENQLGCNSSDVIPLELPPELIKAYYEASLDPVILAETSPLHNLDRVIVPVQIHYGVEDGKNFGGTPPEWSRKLYDALQAAGKVAELYGYDRQGHSFVGDSWVAFMERSAHFFDEHVKNYEP